MLKKIALLIIVVAAIASSFVFLHRPAENQSAATHSTEPAKLLIIGIDGMDPKVTRWLFEQGELPNFKKLAESGAFVDLESSMPPHSPVAWATLATGTNPGKHNIFDFIRRNRDNYLPMLSLSKTVRSLTGTAHESYLTADAFWKTAAAAGVYTDILRWPVTFPPDEIKGHLLSGLGVPDIRGLLSGYTFYTTEDFDLSLEHNKKSIKVNAAPRIETTITGPRISGSEKAETPLIIKPSSTGVELTVNDQSYSVKEGSWSGWIKVNFSLGMMKSAAAITTVYLESAQPLKMYMSALEIDPGDPLYPISYPHDYSKELAKKFGPFHTLGLAEETAALVDGKISEEVFLQHIDQLEDERERIFQSAFTRFQSQEQGALAVVFDSGDRVMHMFWDRKVLFPGEDDQNRLHPAIVNYFRRKDKWLGKIVNELEDSTRLIILSDHGFSSFERAMNVNNWLVENGYMTLQSSTAGTPAALFKGVDWSKTKAYSVGFNSIYLNLKGRERDGIVPADKAAPLKKQLMEQLASSIDPYTNERPINAVFNARKIYSGTALDEDGPDLVIGFNPGYRMAWQSAIGGITKDTFSDNRKHWRGDHLIDYRFVPGVLFTNFPLRSDTPRQVDIAPTILDILGLKAPMGVDGHSLLSQD